MVESGVGLSMGVKFTKGQGTQHIEVYSEYNSHDENAGLNNKT